MAREIPTVGATEATRDSARLIGLAIGGSLLVVTASSGSVPSVEAASFALLGSALVAFLLWRLLLIQALPGAVLLALLAFAYIPTSWDAIALGFPRGLFRTTPEGLALALTSFVAQLLLTAGAAWIGSRSGHLRRACGSLLQTVSPRSEYPIFAVAFVIVLAFALAGAVADGQWSSYLPGQEQVDEARLVGGFRLALFYPIFLLAGCALVGVRLSRGRTRLARIPWWVFTACLTLLVFALQARRVMLAGMAFIVLPQILASGIARGGIARRRLLTLLGAGGILCALLYGSLLWRAAVRHSSGDATTHLRDMADAEVGAEEAVKNLHDRLTYLWLDAAAFEIGGRFGSAHLLEKALMVNVTGNLPGLLFPDKYKRELINCETILLSGPGGDLPCTPFSEGILLAGTLGLSIVAIGWVLSVIVASALYSSGTDAGVVLAGAFLSPLTMIETSAFPGMASLRTLIITAFLHAPLVWLLYGATKYKRTSIDATSQSLRPRG